MVIKGQPLYQGNSQSNVINPLIIVEVLSNSTQAYDRGDKFKFYRSLPTFQEYILIEQSSYSVERYYKQKDDHVRLTIPLIEGLTFNHHHIGIGVNTII